MKKTKKSDIDKHFFENLAKMYCLHNLLEKQVKEAVMEFALFIDRTLSSDIEQKN